jgi:hypothetical protein
MQHIGNCFLVLLTVRVHENESNGPIVECLEADIRISCCPIIVIETIEAENALTPTVLQTPLGFDWKSKASLDRGLAFGVDVLLDYVRGSLQVVNSDLQITVAATMLPGCTADMGGTTVKREKLIANTTKFVVPFASPMADPVEFLSCQVEIIMRLFVPVDPFLGDGALEATRLQENGCLFEYCPGRIHRVWGELRDGGATVMLSLPPGHSPR